MKRVVVGLSGGVDSSVSAYLLQQQGFEVIGVFMKNWHDESVVINNECPWIDDSNDALLVAEKLNIPFHVIDLSEQYKERIVDYMFAEYAAGRTPNPDVLCNREIKFDVFLEAALSLGADYVATGHYCQRGETQINGETTYQLIAGTDKNKDQSYFLCQLTQEQLSKALFPIGHLQKPEVRAIAQEQDLVTANKKDSQGLCFVGKISLPDFLQQKLKTKKGEVFEIIAESNRSFDITKTDNLEDLESLARSFQFDPSMGKKVGDHQGAHFYTIGQRKGLGIGGTPLPLFVIGTDVEKNHIYVGQGDHHWGLHRPALKINKEEINWIRKDLELANNTSLEVDARIRYRQSLQKATLINKEGQYFMVFEETQRGITPGQFAAWYVNDELLGSGVIS